MDHPDDVDEVLGTVLEASGVVDLGPQPDLAGPSGRPLGPARRVVLACPHCGAYRGLRLRWEHGVHVRCPVGHEWAEPPELFGEDWWRQVVAQTRLAAEVDSAGAIEGLAAVVLAAAAGAPPPPATAPG